MRFSSGRGKCFILSYTIKKNMLKEKVTIYYRIKHWFTYHPWLKAISLILAIIVWFYVRDEISHFN